VTFLNPREFLYHQTEYWGLGGITCHYAATKYQIHRGNKTHTL